MPESEHKPQPESISHSDDEPSTTTAKNPSILSLTQSVTFQNDQAPGNGEIKELAQENSSKTSTFIQQTTTSKSSASTPSTQVGLLVTAELEEALKRCREKVERISKECKAGNRKFR